MVNLKGKRILIFQQRGWGKGIGRFLAKKLYEEGCVLAAVTFKKTVHDLIVHQPGVEYQLIISNDDLVSCPASYLRGDTYSLGEICDALGVDSIWPIATTVRNYVRSYKDKYYYSFKQNVSDEVITDYVKATYKSMKIVQGEFKPDIIIAPNFVESFHIMYNLFFAKRGVPMIGITDSKVRGINIFARNFTTEGRFCERIETLNNTAADSPNRAKAKEYIEKIRNEFQSPARYGEPLAAKESSLHAIKNELRPYYHILKWYLEPQVNYWEVVGPTIDYRPPRILLRDHYAQKRYKKFAANYRYCPFEKLDAFVYFPLQVQPESSLDAMAPFFNNQIEMARLTAMSLPGDYVLAVKEHPAMIDKRPPSYLEKIARTPNVKLIDYRISSPEVLERTALVASPNSTTLFEAAFFNKPAIQFGNLATTLHLPNVFKHTDMTTLSKKIKELLALDLRNPEYERGLENYIAAAYDTGLELNYYGIWEKGERGNMDDLYRFYREEIEYVLNKRQERI